jgi:hypothetical protein
MGRNDGGRRMICTFCETKQAVYQENIWGIHFWCADCEEDAAWTIYESIVEDCQ